MKIVWLLVAVVLMFAIAGCIPSQTSVIENQPVQESNNQVKQGSSQESFTDQGKAPTQRSLSLPTVGSVVITNTTATPITSETSISVFTPTPVLLELADKAKRDLAKRLGVDANQIELAKIVPAKWPYDSIGCPLSEEGNINTNAPGYQIFLKANDQVYTFHTDGKDWIGLCTIKPSDEIRTLP